MQRAYFEKEGEIMKEIYKWVEIELNELVRK
jgi:hypothetical protein